MTDRTDDTWLGDEEVHKAVEAIHNAPTQHEARKMEMQLLQETQNDPPNHKPKEDSP